MGGAYSELLCVCVSGHSLEDATKYGWEVPEGVDHKWKTMVSNIQDHIGSLNWGYRTALQDKNVKYMNSLASFVDDHTITVEEMHTCTACPGALGPA